MNVTSCGYCYRHPNTFVIDRPAGSGDYLFLILKSRAWFELGGKTVEAEAGSVILFAKGTPQRYGGLSEEFVNDWMHFEASEEDLALWERLGIPTDRLIPLGTVASLSETVRSVCDEMHGESPLARETARLFATVLWYRLVDLLRLDQPRAMQAHYEQLRRLRNDIYRDPKREWRIDDMARELALSRSYLQHLYVRFFGVSIMEDVLESRMSHAKYLLARTEESVANIAERCGYKSDVHFMRQFKRVLGMRPTEYREKGRRI